MSIELKLKKKTRNNEGFLHYVVKELRADLQGPHGIDHSATGSQPQGRDTVLVLLILMQTISESYIFRYLQTPRQSQKQKRKRNGISQALSS